MIGTDQITIRLACPTDAPALERLATLDAGALLGGPMLVADCGGELVAAVPLEGGRPLADPFRPTAEIVGLLDLRARQLGAPESRSGRRLIRWRRPAVRPSTA
jgi:hypothetical protein